MQINTSSCIGYPLLVNKETPIYIYLDKENERHEKEPQVNQRLRRDVAGPKYYIEAMMTMDKVSCDFYGNVTMNFILAVANMVNYSIIWIFLDLNVEFRAL